MTTATDREEFLNRARGLMVGLVLADSQTNDDRTAPVPVTCLTHLACFTLEGMIRASVRGTLKGTDGTTGVVWHAWSRWAHGQRIAGDFARHWSQGAGPVWPDGWLRDIEPFRERRGSAPATVRALRSSAHAPTTPPTTSAGHHALNRGLPIGILWEGQQAERYGSQLAALTHGHREAIEAAAQGAALVGQLIRSDRRAAGVGDPFGAVIDQCLEHETVAARGTASHALVHACGANQEAATFDDVLQAARPHGAGALVAAGALFGARFGLRSIPSESLNEVELVWVADTLAQDAVRELFDDPIEGPPETSDPTWWTRYPGG